MGKYVYYLVRHWWFFLWIRKNEFHKSLDFDSGYCVYVLKSDSYKIQEYYTKLDKRRQIAHQKQQ